MKKNWSKFVLIAMVFLAGFSIRHIRSLWEPTRALLLKSQELYTNQWPTKAVVFTTVSKIDSKEQKNYFIKSTNIEPAPLLVSLHHWNGTYKTIDSMAYLAAEANINYLRPNARGENNHPDACCSDLVMEDITEAIEFAVNNGNVDQNEIYLVGVSGGGYTALCYYLKTDYNIKKVSVWASITDLNAWYRESKIRKAHFVEDLLNCVGATQDSQNLTVLLEKRSPLYWGMDTSNLKDTELSIYAGVYDGITGSVPFSHSINFYNKLSEHMGAVEDSIFVTNDERLYLYEGQWTNKNPFKTIQDRKVFLHKEYRTVELTLFEGGHEILYDHAFNELLTNK